MRINHRLRVVERMLAAGRQTQEIIIRGGLPDPDSDHATVISRSGAVTEFASDAGENVIAFRQRARAAAGDASFVVFGGLPAA